MPTVSQSLNVPFRKGELFGVEIETEGVGLPEVMPAGWSIEDDGSLRGEFPNSRAEYILSQPVTLITAQKRIESLNEKFKEMGSIVNMSFRCSTHVHYNVSHFYHRQLINMLYTYCLVEPAMLGYCEPHRRGNRFCLRTSDAYAVIRAITKISEMGVRYIPNIVGRDHRYSACNLAAIQKLGTLEFRALEGTVDTAKIVGWMTLIAKLGAFACQEKVSPKDICEEFEKVGPSAFLKLVFGENHPLNAEEWHGDMLMQHSLSLPIAYSYSPEAEEQAIPSPFAPRARKIAPARMNLNDWARIQDDAVAALPAIHPHDEEEEDE